MSTGRPDSTYSRGFSLGRVRDPLIRSKASRNGFRRTFGDGAWISRNTSMYASRGRSPSYSPRLSLEKMLRTVLNIGALHLSRRQTTSTPPKRKNQREVRDACAGLSHTDNDK